MTINIVPFNFQFVFITKYKLWIIAPQTVKQIQTTIIVQNL